MGCNIHAFVERREGNHWVYVPVTGERERRSVAEWTKEYPDQYPMAPQLDIERNYALFAILADVRNLGGFVPIAKPRGLPADVSPEVAAEARRYHPDGHHHSHLAVGEILAFDWTRTVTEVWYVSAASYHEWIQFGRLDGEIPRDKRTYLTESDILVSESEMQAIVTEIAKGFAHWRDAKKAIAELKPETYCEIKIRRPYYEMCLRFWAHVMPRLTSLGRPEDVRLVFWFDN